LQTASCPRIECGFDVDSGSNVLAQPYELVWLTGEQTLMQDTSMAVLELYKEGGFEIDEEFRELPDHIAAELEFLYLLLFRQAQARRDNDSQALPMSSRCSGVSWTSTLLAGSNRSLRRWPRARGQPSIANWPR